MRSSTTVFLITTATLSLVVLCQSTSENLAETAQLEPALVSSLAPADKTRLWKRKDNQHHSMECDENGCRPKVKLPKRLHKRSKSSSSSSEQKKRKNKKCPYCEGDRRRRATFMETEIESETSHLQRRQAPPKQPSNNECVGEGCTPKSRAERSSFKSRARDDEDEEYEDDERGHGNNEDDEDHYSDDPPPPPKKKKVKKPTPKTTKLQDLFTHFDG